jgi:hypothetical protein
MTNSVCCYFFTKSLLSDLKKHTLLPIPLSIVYTWILVAWGIATKKQRETNMENYAFPMEITPKKHQQSYQSNSGDQTHVYLYMQKDWDYFLFDLRKVIPSFFVLNKFRSIFDIESNFFLRITQYNADAHNMHSHSPLWIHIRKFYPYEHLRRTEHQQIWRFPKSPMTSRVKERRLPLNT